MYTLSLASFLPPAIGAIGSSNVSWLSKIPENPFTGLLGALSPWGEALGWRVVFPQSMLFLREMRSSFLVLGASCPHPLGCGTSPPACWHGTCAAHHPSRFVRGEEPHNSTENMRRKASPKPPCPVSCSMRSWHRYCSFPACGVAASCKGAGHWRASMALGRAAAPRGGERRRVCWASRQLSAVLAVVSSIPRQDRKQRAFLASS